MSSDQVLIKFLSNDTDKIAEIVTKYPKQIPLPVVSDLIGIDQNSLRAAIMEQGELGIGWRKAGKLNHGFAIPTAPFARWYLKFKTLGV